MTQQKEEENLKMGENNVYKAVEKYLDECLLDEMSQNMAKSDQEYHLKINVYMLKRVIQIILSEMEKDNERKSDVASEGGKMTAKERLCDKGYTLDRCPGCVDWKECQLKKTPKQILERS